MVAKPDLKRSVLTRGLLKTHTGDYLYIFTPEILFDYGLYICPIFLFYFYFLAMYPMACGILGPGLGIELVSLVAQVQFSSVQSSRSVVSDSATP